MNRKIRNWACGVSSLAMMFNVMSSSIAAAQSCSDLAGDIASRITDFQKNTEKASDQVNSDHKSATSSDYSNNYFKKFDDLNKNAKEAYQLVNTAHDLSGFTKPLAEGKVQSKLPPQVTITMGNAVELAQAAMDEDNSKLDLAVLRCDQSTEGSALEAYLKQADSSTVSTYKTTKKNACKIIQVLADLQDKREKLNEFRENGYPLFYLHAKNKVKFSGKERTIQLKVDLRMNPEYPEKPVNDVTINGQPVLLGQLEDISLSYNSWFKFSDNSWTDLNLFAALINDTQGDDSVCLKPDIKITSSVKARLCIDVASITTDKVKVYVKGRFHYNDDWKQVELGTITVPAPFGYLADLSDMKEKKMQDLKSKVADRIASLLPAYDDVKEKAEQWQNPCQ